MQQKLVKKELTTLIDHFMYDMPADHNFSNIDILFVVIPFFGFFLA